MLSAAVPDAVMLAYASHRVRYLRTDGAVFMAHDLDDDIHYFFA